MFRIVSLSMLLFAAAARGSASTVDNPDGVVFEAGYGSIVSEANYPPNHEGQLMSPLEGILPPVRENEYTGAPWEGQDWGYDYFVYDSPNGVGECQDFDFDPATGYIFAAFDTYHTTNDSVIVYRSTNNGATWTYWGCSYNPDGAMDNARIRVITTGGITHVCCMCREDDSASDALWLRRWHIDGTGSTWEQISADASYADMDADVGSSGYLYATWVPSGSTDVYGARNALGGAGWVNSTSLYGTAQTSPYPAIAAGTGGVVSVAFIDTRLTTNDEVRIKRSTTYGSTWLESTQVSNNGAAADLYGTDIAHARGSSAWINATFDFSGVQNLCWYTSTNTGSSWTYGGIFPGVGDDEYAGSLRSDKGSGHVTLAYNVDPGDIVYFAWANASDPTNFTTPVQINDQAAASWGPTAGWNDAGYSCVLYTRTDYSLWFDTWSNTGIEDGPASGLSGIGVSPNPFMDAASIAFSLESGAPVDVCIYDVSGRLVATLADGAALASGSHQLTWNGTDASGAPVPGGVYICRLTAPGSVESTRMVLVR